MASVETLLRQILEDEVEPDEDGHLRQHRQARRERVDAVLLVEGHQLLLLLALVARMLLLQRLDLWRICLHFAH